MDTVYPMLKERCGRSGCPWWLSGLLIDGVYLATAWVVSVMLPPMAIFFPLFTLAGGLRLSAARGVQSRPRFQAGRARTASRP